MLFRLNRPEKESVEPEPQRECRCLEYHLDHATTARSGLTTRCAFIGTFCSRCGSAYWTFLDSTRMSQPEEIHRATKTKRCGESELKDIAYEWIMRAYHLGIPKNAIAIDITPTGALRTEGPSGTV